MLQTIGQGMGDMINARGRKPLHVAEGLAILNGDDPCCQRMVELQQLLQFSWVRLRNQAAQQRRAAAGEQ